MYIAFDKIRSKIRQNLNFEKNFLESYSLKTIKQKNEIEWKRSEGRFMEVILTKFLKEISDFPVIL